MYIAHSPCRINSLTFSADRRTACWNFRWVLLRHWWELTHRRLDSCPTEKSPINYWPVFASNWNAFEKLSQCQAPWGNGWGPCCNYISSTLFLCRVLFLTHLQVHSWKTPQQNCCKQITASESTSFVNPTYISSFAFVFPFQSSLFEQKFHFLPSFGNWTPEQLYSTASWPSVLAKFTQSVHELYQFTRKMFLKTTWWTYLQGNNGDTGIENWLMDTGGGVRRGWDEWRE